MKTDLTTIIILSLIALTALAGCDNSNPEMAQTAEEALHETRIEGAREKLG